MEAKRKLTRGKLWAESGGIGFRKNCVFRTLSEALELRRVEEAKDPRHRELRHRKEEGAEQRDGHHQVKVDEKYPVTAMDGIERERRRAIQSTRSGTRQAPPATSTRPTHK